MTNLEKMVTVKTLLGLTNSADDDLIATYLSIAGREILTWKYSYTEDAPTEVPAELEMTQVYAVVAGYSQAGAENQTQHHENGISRRFRYPDMIHYIHSTVIPYCKVM